MLNSKDVVDKKWQTIESIIFENIAVVQYRNYKKVSTID